MRISTSLAAAIVFALVFGVATHAGAVPDIRFSSGTNRLPSQCELSSDGKSLDCDALTSEVLTFTVIIDVSSEGMQGYSFGAQWDDDGQESLTNVSGSQARDGTLYVSRNPPVVTAGFTPDSSISSITQSSSTNAGLLTNWQALSSSPDSSLYTGAVLDGASYRAGRISVQLNNLSGTVLQLGFFDPNADSFLAAGGAQITPNFFTANINTAPEPAAVLSAIAGLAALGYLGVRHRRSR